MSIIYEIDLKIMSKLKVLLEKVISNMVESCLVNNAGTNDNSIYWKYIPGFDKIYENNLSLLYYD